MSQPKLTVAILSWNRLHYLRATLLSARACIRYPDIEWIVSDNASVESGLREFLDNQSWVQHRWYREQTHAAAMNEIVERATGDYLLLWPEDVQFVVEGDWMRKLILTMEEQPWIGSVGLNFLRRKTYRRLLGRLRTDDLVPACAELVRRKQAFRLPRKIEAPLPLHSFGFRLPGVIGSGIPSLTRRSCWQQLGPWKISDPSQTNLVDSSLGAEEDMILRFQNSGKNWQQAIPMRPVAADIINDSQGCKAKIRRGKRYGEYTPPATGDFYYRILPEDSLPAEDGGFPLAFEDVVKPVGFELPLDSEGNLIKTSINTSVCSEIV